MLANMQVFSEAYKWVRDRRCCVMPNSGFLQQLKVRTAYSTVCSVLLICSGVISHGIVFVEKFIFLCLKI